MTNKIIPNQHVTLRVLTMKSKLGFGQYADYTIERIFINQKQDYLQWVYYYCSNISFCDEILEKLKIKDWVIKKPGITATQMKVVLIGKTLVKRLVSSNFQIL